MSKTREERRLRKREILTGISWMLLCVVVICGAHYVTDHLIVDTPVGVYAEVNK